MCISMHWRPNPHNPDPDMPGQKMSIAAYALSALYPRDSEEKRLLDAMLLAMLR